MSGGYCLRGHGVSGKTGGWPTPSTVQGAVSPRKTVGVSETDEKGRCPGEGDGPVYGTHVVGHDLVWRMEGGGDEHSERRCAALGDEGNVGALGCVLGGREAAEVSGSFTWSTHPN